MIQKTMPARIGRFFVRVVLIAYSVMVVFPLIWTVLSSFKINREFYANPWAFPAEFHFENYITAWVQSQFSRYFLNSILVVVASSVVNVILSAAIGYVMAKYNFKWVKALSIILIVSLMIPGVMILMPQFYRANAMGLTNSLAVLCVIYIVGSIPYNSFLLSRFIKGLHSAYIEAAQVDGASEFQIFFKLVLPMAKSGIAIVLILNVMGYWNEYVTALTFLVDEAKFTVPIGISYLSASMQYRTDYGALFAGLTIGMVPILIVYMFFQNQLQEGIAGTSGVKE